MWSLSQWPFLHWGMESMKTVSFRLTFEVVLVIIYILQVVLHGAKCTLTTWCHVYNATLKVCCNSLAPLNTRKILFSLEGIDMDVIVVHNWLVSIKCASLVLFSLCYVHFSFFIPLNRQSFPCHHSPWTVITFSFWLVKICFSFFFFFFS